ncbi:MAG TPA: HPr family phosphocarrier protein [Candidatus Binataceae bacterium]|nr:HPr family phosphocarrier protein [Candidatus Binataceae bacterium]
MRVASDLGACRRHESTFAGLTPGRERFTGRPPASIVVEMSVLEGTVEVTNRLGLHLRAATKLAETVRGFQCKVTIAGSDGQADARSVINLMMLGAAMGTRLKVRAEGPDARAALDAVQRLFQDRFGED